MISLQKAITNLTQELNKCYVASADLEKLLELLNRNKNSRESVVKTSSDIPKEDTGSITQISEEVTSEVDLLVNDSDYQVFSNDINGKIWKIFIHSHRS